MRKQPAEWEKVFVNHISDKELISKIHKALIQLNNNKKINQIKNIGRGTKDIFPKKTSKWPTDT